MATVSQKQRKKRPIRPQGGLAQGPYSAKDTIIRPPGEPIGSVLMSYLLAPFAQRNSVLTLSIVFTVFSLVAIFIWPEHEILIAIPLLVFGFLSVVGIRDVMQSRHAILRNYPIAAHLRFFFEEIRP